MIKLIITIYVIVQLLFITHPAHAVVPVADLRQTEASIMGLPYEVAVIRNRYDREARRWIGLQTEASVGVDWRWSNGVFTHNHPCNLPNACTLPSLSIPDIDACAVGYVRECRAVSVSLGYPMVCRAWRIGARWYRIKNIAAERAQLHALIDFKPWPLQAALMQWYMSGVAQRYKFGYECKAWQ